MYARHICEYAHCIRCISKAVARLATLQFVWPHVSVLVTLLPEWVRRSIAISCLCVQSHISKTTRPNHHVPVRVTYGRGSEGNVIRYVLSVLWMS